MKPSPREPIETETMPKAPRPPTEERRFALVVEADTGAEMALLPPDTPLVVGRSAPADVQVEHPTLSRRHARFTLSGHHVHVEDMGSRNGTWVAGRRVDHAEIEVGDEVVLGGASARVHVLGPSGQSIGCSSHPDALFRGLRSGLGVMSMTFAST